jgi:hypothetical protein
LVDVVERTRGFGVAAILSPQVVEGMGGAEAAARIIGSTHTILLHQVPMPEAIVKVAGTRLVMETSITDALSHLPRVSARRGAPT